MAARRSFIVAPDAVILPVTGEAPLAIDTRSDAMAPGAPEIIVVPWQAHGVAGDAVVLFMTGKACRI